MSEYENGIKQPPLSILSKIVDYFNVSLDYLAGRSTIKITIDALQEKLTTQSDDKISIDDLINLKEDEKEVIYNLYKFRINRM